MVTLIFEGPDNLGKSTIINKIVSNFKDTRDICMMHSRGPQNLDGEDPFIHQTNVFRDKATKLLMMSSSELHLKTCPKNIAILDRAWYGEYVYGQIYRNADPTRVLNMINTCNLMLGATVFVVIQLTASPEFIVSHDDGLSFTSDLQKEERLAKVAHEIELFDECFEKMQGGKHIIKVNVEGDNLNYRNIEDIYNEIISKLNKMGITL